MRPIRWRFSWATTAGFGARRTRLARPGRCAPATDASHFQNLNGSLGSLAEVVSLAAASDTPYTMMAGLGVNGTAGREEQRAQPADWPQILGGEGGPVAIDPGNSANWYVNNQAGVSIHAVLADRRLHAGGVWLDSPVVTDADVGGDGLTMTTPAPFLVDPLDPTQLLVGTCRVWRGPANGSGWSASNAISPILDGSNEQQRLQRRCADSLDGRDETALRGGEVVYVGMYGSADGGAKLAGHVFERNLQSRHG